MARVCQFTQFGLLKLALELVLTSISGGLRASLDPIMRLLICENLRVLRVVR